MWSSTSTVRSTLSPRHRRVVLPGAGDLLRLGDQQVAGLAVEHDADDVQVLQLQGDRLAGTTARTSSRPR